MADEVLESLLRAGAVRGWHDPDSFYARLAAKYRGVTAADEPDLIRAVKALRTQFFKVNLISHGEFVKIVLPEFSSGLRAAQPESGQDVKYHLSLEEIDSFNSIKTVRPQDVAHLVPVRLSEDQIQTAIEKILGEGTRERDWGGERSDIFTRLVVIGGERKRAAFILKGPGTKGTLFPAKLGKRGDQIHRAFSEPADIVILQYVGRVDSTVDQQLEAFARTAGVPYCMVDGTETARLLVAYQCICRECGAPTLDHGQHVCG